MQTFVYKVNRNQNVGFHHGDWQDFFKKDQPSRWGLEDVVCIDHHPEPDDRIICYQTDLNEVIGTAIVDGYKRGYLYLRSEEGPFPRGIKVRDLKKIDNHIAQLTAFQQGLIKTLYPISNSEACHLLSVIKHYWMDADE